MTPTKKKNGRTVTAEKSSKTNQIATRIVAARDRLTLEIARFSPWFQQIDALALLIVALFTAYTALIVWGWLS